MGNFCGVIGTGKEGNPEEGVEQRMEIVLIRHGEPDYTPCDRRGFIGQGRGLAPLTPAGRACAETYAKDPALSGCERLISSPYTRALETAAIFSRAMGLPIEVEVDLHEWLVDKTFQDSTSEESMAAAQEFERYGGRYPLGETRNWETAAEIVARVVPVFDKYLDMGCRKIAVVSHGMVMRRFTGGTSTAYCRPYRISYDKGFPCLV